MTDNQEKQVRKILAVKTVLEWDENRDEHIRAHQAAVHAHINKVLEQMDDETNPLVGIVATVYHADGKLGMINAGAVPVDLWMRADTFQRYANYVTYRNRGELPDFDSQMLGVQPETGTDRVLLNGYSLEQLRKEVRFGWRDRLSVFFRGTLS
jgi:hypothetical protein